VLGVYGAWRSAAPAGMSVIDSGLRQAYKVFVEDAPKTLWFRQEHYARICTAAHMIASLSRRPRECMTKEEL